MFTPITLEQKDTYFQYWQALPEHSIDYTLANIWGWERYYGLNWYFDGKLCWLKQEKVHPCMWAPVGDWHTVDWANHPLLTQGATLTRVPKSLADTLEKALPGRIECIEDRGHWEYIYNTQELATLSGNRFHKKKNHVNGFKKAYGEPQYFPITSHIIEDVLALEDEWCQWHECADSPSLRAENQAINRVLGHWDKIPGLVGGALYVDKLLVAFSIGERLDAETLGVHYEKARNGYRGVYQMVNKLFASESGKGYTYLNRAQDLDEEGLRQAKLSYLPAHFLHKYTVTISAV